MTWLILLGAILAEVAATLSLKGSQSHPALYVVVVVGYAAAFVCLTVVLRRGLALGVAYGIWGAAGVALTAVFAWLVFGERLTPVMIGGIVLVIGGVLLVETGSRHDPVAPDGDR
ncbi:SMR family transporter [uncultured Williamsia sp.]|uniref:DMT family transporter n=1 Tax=uncultured Williamsia sp. TaxID=259311 RepID=UPI002629B9D7|nr:SMR family transporter [uncultured Williamsia sp.]